MSKTEPKTEPAVPVDQRHVDRQAELDLQAAVHKAVELAHKNELPKLGGGQP